MGRTRVAMLTTTNRGIENWILRWWIFPEPAGTFPHVFTAMRVTDEGKGDW